MSETNTPSHTTPASGAEKASAVVSHSAASPLATPATGGIAPQPEHKTRHAPAGNAHLKPRHSKVGLSFAALVILPTLLTALYLYAFARDQYASTIGFTIRQEEGQTSAAFPEALSFLASSPRDSNGDQLHGFIQSQAMLARMTKRFDLAGHYSTGWPYDPLFAIWPGHSVEDLLWIWNRFVDLSYDRTTNLFAIQINAFTPQVAQEIGQLILEESQAMINDLNIKARRDATTLANDELGQAVDRLRRAREALTGFRATTQIIDPIADLEGRLGVIRSLQQQLAQSLVDFDLQSASTEQGSPRRIEQENRIAAIRARIMAEKEALSTNDTPNGLQNGESYPDLLARYEGLQVDVEFAQGNYLSALAALDIARLAAARQTLYLASHIPPTLSEVAQYPQRFRLVAFTLGFLLLIWSVGVLIYYNLRDRG